MVQTIRIPTPAESRRIAMGKVSNASKSILLEEDQKFVSVLIRLAPGVQQPGDYPALKAAIEAIPGIQEIIPMVQGITPTELEPDIQTQIVVASRIKPISTATAPVE